MIRHWATFSTCYFKLSDDPIYLKPDEDMLLLRLNYIAFYFPRIYFYKFGLIKSILTTTLPSETRNTAFEVAPDKIVDCIDLSDDFVEHADLARINFKHFPDSMFHLLTGNQNEIRQYRDFYQPLVPFFRYMGLEKEYLDLMPS